MNFKLLSIFLTSAIVATSATMIPAISLAEDVANPVAPEKTEDATRAIAPTPGADVTAASGDNATASATDENSEEIQTRGSRSHRRNLPNQRLKRPPSADEVNNAGNRNRSGGWLWF